MVYIHTAPFKATNGLDMCVHYVCIFFCQNHDFSACMLFSDPITHNPKKHFMILNKYLISSEKKTDQVVVQL